MESIGPGGGGGGGGGIGGGGEEDRSARRPSRRLRGHPGDCAGRYSLLLLPSPRASPPPLLAAMPP